MSAPVDVLAARIAGLSVGDAVDVLLSQPFDRETRTEPEPKWESGYRVAAFSTALDRPFRIDVEGPMTYRGCAPECVRSAQGAQP